MRGKFIVIEGIDRSGKETQCRKLSERLRREHHLHVRDWSFPQYDKMFGSMIGAWLRKELGFPIDCIQLLHTLDKQTAKPKMERMLDDGKWIICDRYFLSQVAYGLQEISDIRWLMNLGEHLLKPDLQLIVSIPPEESFRRGEGQVSDRNESDFEKLRKVARSYHSIRLYFENVLELDGEGSVEEVHERIWKEVSKFEFGHEEDTEDNRITKPLHALTPDKIEGEGIEFEDE